MTDPGRQKSEFDDYATSYEATVNRSLAFTGLKVDLFTRIKADYIKAVLAEEFTHPGRVDALDIGCGVGTIHPHILQSLGTLSGVDVSADSIARARADHPGVRYETYEGRRLPFANASFDLAYTICVMHHVPPSQWQEFAAEMKRVLRPGGVALVFEHNPYNLLTRYTVARCEFDADAVLLTARRTEALLSGAGFHDVASRYIAAIPATGPLVRSVEGAFARVPLGAQYITRGRT